MIILTPVDVSKKSDECAVSLLVAFTYPVCLGTARIDVSPTAFTVFRGEKPVASYKTAAPAVRRLRKLYDTGLKNSA